MATIGFELLVEAAVDFLPLPCMLATNALLFLAAVPELGLVLGTLFHLHSPPQPPTSTPLILLFCSKYSAISLLTSVVALGQPITSPLKPATCSLCLLFHQVVILPQRLHTTLFRWGGACQYPYFHPGSFDRSGFRA